PRSRTSGASPPVIVRRLCRCDVTGRLAPFRWRTLGGTGDPWIGRIELRCHLRVTLGLALLWVPLAPPVRSVRCRDRAAKSETASSFCCRHKSLLSFVRR